MRDSFLLNISVFIKSSHPSLLASCFVLIPFIIAGCFTSFDPVEHGTSQQSDDAETTWADDSDDGYGVGDSTDNSSNGGETDKGHPQNVDTIIDQPDYGAEDCSDSGDGGANTGESCDCDTDPQDEPEPEKKTVSYCEEAEENELVVLECGDGVIDSIDFASFGEYAGSCAGGDAAIGKCHFEDTVDVIRQHCLGEPLCQLIADKKEIFDDPCKKDKHRLIVEYTCRYDTSCPQGSLKAAPGKCGCNNPDYDKDGDGSADCNDECDYDPQKIFSGLCGCAVEEVDEDKDGLPSCLDECDKDPHKTEPGICGCGKSDDNIGDSDGDGTINCKDDCPSDPNKVKKGICGCGEVDDPTDSDNDGKPDCADRCPYDPHKYEPGHCGCSNPEICLGYCEDTPNYKDPRGESCREWEDGDCLIAWLYGYTKAQTQEIQRYCPESCGLCWLY